MGDMLDEMMSNELHARNCQVPLQRLGEGWYLFGTRRIFARIVMGKLTVRVGGGWMSV